MRSLFTSLLAIAVTLLIVQALVAAIWPGHAMTVSAYLQTLAAALIGSALVWLFDPRRVRA